jgi:hypothetical protein
MGVEVKYFRYILISLIVYEILCYGFIFSITRMYGGNFDRYIYFSDGYIPLDEPVHLYCADNLIKSRPDRSFFYHGLHILGISFPGEMPPYFGITKKDPNENYWWSFKEWQFVSAQKNGGPYIMLFDECAFEGK